MTKEERIQKEKIRLLDLFNAMNENELSILIPLIEQASFLRIALEDLEQSINENGVVETYKNGENQYGKKSSAELQSYNSTMKVYVSIMDKLYKYVPRVKEKPLTPIQQYELSKMLKEERDEKARLERNKKVNDN